MNQSINQPINQFLKLCINKNIVLAARERSRLVQLAGAVSMLVLLGVPWVFSAFGVVDDNDADAVKLTQGVFQVVLFELKNINIV